VKIYIKTDIEGVSGVYCDKFVYSDRNRPDMIAEARRMLAHDLNACIEGCVRAGATEIIAVDGHAGGSNLLRSQVDDRAWFINGDTRSTFPELDGSDALILLGFHAMAGAETALLEHTINSRSIQNIWLNDRKVGEVGLLSGAAAEHGVPTVLVTGDDKVCAEAAEWIPGVSTCEVKKSYSCNGCCMPPLAVTRERIIAKTIESLSRIGKIAVPEVAHPIRYRVELVERGRVPENPAIRRIDGRTYEITSDTIEQAMRFFQ